MIELPKMWQIWQKDVPLVSEENLISSWGMFHFISTSLYIHFVIPEADNSDGNT